MIDDQEAIALATQIIDEVFVGIMTTVDEHDAPVSRLIGAIAVIVSNIHTLELLCPKLGIKSPYTVKLDKFADEDRALGMGVGI